MGYHLYYLVQISKTTTLIGREKRNVENLSVSFSIVMKNYERFSLIEGKKNRWLNERSV